MLCRRALPAGVERKAEGVCGLGGWGEFLAADLNVGVEGAEPTVEGEGAGRVLGDDRTGLCIENCELDCFKRGDELNGPSAVPMRFVTGDGSGRDDSLLRCRIASKIL